MRGQTEACSRRSRPACVPLLSAPPQALFHLTAGLLQALTIVGIPTALTQWQLATLAM